MGNFLGPEDLRKLSPAEEAAAPTPLPAQVISNGEFTPWPQTESQARFERRLYELADEIAPRQGLDRRRFLKTTCGMAAAFLAMNQVYGPLFKIDRAEAAEPERAQARAQSLAGQFVFDDQVHFLRDDSPHDRFIGLRGYTGKALNPKMGPPGTMQNLQFANFVKEVFLDSDTQVALLSNAPGDKPLDWFLTNDQVAEAREAVNKFAGSNRLLIHSVFTPGHPQWLEEIDRVHEIIKPNGWKGYTTGDPNGPSQYMWRMDDEKLAYKAFEKFEKAGIRNVCVHKGLLPADAEQKMPGVTAHANVDDLGKAARDWPNLNFIVYHAGYKPLPKPDAAAERAFEETGRIDWVSDLAAIPEKFGVSNVHADLGASFGLTAITNPRYCAGMVAMLIKGLGVEKVCWGTDSVWFGSPQWQIEAFRRIEVPEDLQKKFGWAPLGPAEGAVKTAILGLNNARIWGVRLRAASLPDAQTDKLAQLKRDYALSGEERSNRAYGWVARG